jgi:hypothetical protein
LRVFPVSHGILCRCYDNTFAFFSKYACDSRLTLDFFGKKRKIERQAKISSFCGGDGFSSFVRRKPTFGRRSIVGKLHELHHIDTSDVMGVRRLRMMSYVCVQGVSSKR